MPQPWLGLGAQEPPEDPVQLKVEKIL